MPPAESVVEAIGLIDRQMAASRFRGVRPMGGLSEPLPVPEVLRALQERDLVFEVMTHPDQLVEAARGLESFSDLTVVVEHAGWPRSGSEEERVLWRVGIDALAGAGQNVLCKLSGLAMPFASVGAEALGPWLEHAIAAFGVDRCLFASNFPVDSMFGTFDELYSTFSEVTAGLDESSCDKLFAANAEPRLTASSSCRLASPPSGSWPKATPSTPSTGARSRWRAPTWPWRWRSRRLS